MAKEKQKGKNYSIYFKKQQSEFIDNYVDDVSAYFQGKIEEDIVNCEEFFKKNINDLSHKLKRQKQLLSKARANKKTSETAFQNLRGQYLARKDQDKRDSFLGGATGKRLLLQAQLTKEQFKEKILGTI